MIETVTFNNREYPKFHTTGFAAQYAFPFARQVCHGIGYDIGCMKREWAFPGATPIDITFDDGWHATNLPEGRVDYIFSSHCLEHVPDWVGVIDYWTTRIKSGGTLFLYLPCYEEDYWRPWNNRKHMHILTPQYLQDWMIHKKMKHIFVSERDLYNSFSAMCEI